MIQKGNVPKRVGDAIGKNLKEAFNRMKHFLPTVVKDDKGEGRVKPPYAKICTYAAADREKKESKRQKERLTEQKAANQ